MQLAAFCGYSGAGKTTLLEGVIAQLRQRGLTVATVKHAHHAFDVDTPGKDSHRHRSAGAGQVLVASRRRWALMVEAPQEADQGAAESAAEKVAEPPPLAELLSHLAPCDWVLAEGFKREAAPKIEVWRAATGQPLLHPHDPWVQALASDAPAGMAPHRLPWLNINQPSTLAEFLIAHAARFQWPRPL
jgi:molybdopterin-guanine dinucleotide biosynthesis protein B